MVVTIDSIMKPVFGAPVGTGVASTGGIATHTRGEYARIPRAALVLVHEHEAARIAQAFHGRDFRHALERGQDHRIAERQCLRLAGHALGVVLDDGHLAIAHLSDLAVDHPVDVTLAQLRLHQSLGIAHTAQAHVPDVRLAGDEGHRHLVAQLAFAQVGIDDHRELVGWAEATGALCSADHDRARIFEKCLIARPGLFGVFGGANRLRESVGPQTRHFAEGETRSRGDEQVVVIDASSVACFERSFVGEDAHHAVIAVSNRSACDRRSDR
jgi:hypothetical protein